MTKHIVDHDRQSQLSIQTSGDTWVITKQTTLTVPDDSVVLIAAGHNTNVIDLFGDVVSTGEKGIGIAVEGNDNLVTVEDGAKISGATTLTDAGTGNEYDIDGTVTAKGVGIYSTEMAKVVNTGTLSATKGDAIITDAGSTIVNKASGEITASHDGIYLNGSGTTKIINDGTISGPTAIYDNDDGKTRIINHGTITGDIYLGNGNDYIDTRHGTVASIIDGVGGNDTYLISNKSVEIVEGVNQGTDTIKSTVSYILGGNIEKLILLGHDAAHGTGNELGNTVTGNAGDNTLKGLAGLDFLNGGRGNDILTGGADQDNFVFAKGGDTDTVTDFTQGSDYVDIEKFSGISDFASLSPHISQHGQDTWITFGHGDKLILEHVTASALTSDDFVFA
jgi:Ca2+-binding RTX toxin-like protein